jgi:hypothetical protein
MSKSKLRRCILAGQDKYKTLEVLFENIDLSFAQNVLKNAFILRDQVDPQEIPWDFSEP